MRYRAAPLSQERPGRKSHRIQGPVSRWPLPYGATPTEALSSLCGQLLLSSETFRPLAPFCVCVLPEVLPIRFLLLSRIEVTICNN